MIYWIHFTKGENCMRELNFESMQKMQAALQDRYKDKWPALCPEIAKEKLLWMMIEAGEMADIIKKQGNGQIMDDPEIREHFIEEMCDTLMYFNDVMRCYSITPDELERVYLEKHRRNMGRW